MAHMMLLVLALALLSCAESQVSYNYPQPQIPFHLTPRTPAVGQSATKFVVQTLGQHGRTYELQAHRAPAVYVAHETFAPNKYYQAQQPAASYYRQPQALTITTAQVQPVVTYGAPQQQPKLDNNPLPYAVITLPNGQRQLDGGHGSGPVPRAAGEPTVAPRIGDYNAQSQSAMLDNYDYKQSVPGDSRGYRRIVSNCQPNGQCQQLQLNPGQIDANHFEVLNSARAKTLPAKSEDRKEIYVTPGAEINAEGQLRPRDRRLNLHIQEQLARYPYN
ncbi:uncharacterized protein LOC111597879 [Drosophila hydei]|uniref:Uncharacterized protein LOC111597879 n=1 Tax=Drosophila hydei TaxID=7224 RepID=A0A6J1LTK5_DROHY|nr:uncharacterized protein LOC111597879 [Drosophila hydei]